MAPTTLHCIAHLTSAETLKKRFPAVYDIKFSDPSSPEHYSLSDMMIWATVPYIVWQLAYHLLITVRRADKIAEGRPTSFTWLRKSYAKTFLGKVVLSLPESLQEPVFMVIQYAYALLTMIPCPFWFWYRWASGTFLMSMFVWSVHNGGTYYIDVFGQRFQKELEQLKKDVAQWQSSPDGSMSPPLEPTTASKPANKSSESEQTHPDHIPPLDSPATSTGVHDSHGSGESTVRGRK